MRPGTRDKIQTLRDRATIPGERQAAEAALARLGPEPSPPAFGSPDYVKAILAHRDVVDFCSIHRDLASLNHDEVKTIMNWTRFGGTPWEAGAKELNRIAAKIRSAGRG